MSEGGIPSACPYLGLRDDPATSFSYASSGQGCHSTSRYFPVDLSSQSVTCLTAGHDECPRYRAAGPSPLPAAQPITALGIAIQDSLAAPKPRRRSAVGLLPVVLAILVVTAVGVAIGIAVAAAAVGSAAASPPAAAPIASPAPASSALEPTPTPGPSSPPAASPGALPTLQPSASTSARPSPAPSATARPKATLRTHVVVHGETLTGIAARYGVTPQAIARANGITNLSLIIPGTVLVIP